MTVEQASRERFARGRAEYGGAEWKPSLPGMRGTHEAQEEVTDAFSYIELERECLLRGRDPDIDDLNEGERKRLDVIDQLQRNLAETFTGLDLLTRMLAEDGAHRWEPLAHARG